MCGRFSPQVPHSAQPSPLNWESTPESAPREGSSSRRHREQLAYGHKMIARGETMKAVETLQELCSGHDFRGDEASFGAMCHEALAKALQQQGLAGASVRAMAAAVDLDPTDAALRVRHGIARASTGDHSAAIAEYETSLRIWPGCTLAHSHWGVSLHALGDKQGALQQFEVCYLVVECRRADPNPNPILPRLRSASTPRTTSLRSSLPTYARKRCFPPGSRTPIF